MIWKISVFGKKPRTRSAPGPSAVTRTSSALWLPSIFTLAHYFLSFGTPREAQIVRVIGGKKNQAVLFPLPGDVPDHSIEGHSAVQSLAGILEMVVRLHHQEKSLGVPRKYP